MRRTWLVPAAILVGLLLVGSIALAASLGGAEIGPLGSHPPASNVRFFSPPPDPDALAQVQALRAAGRSSDARVLDQMVRTPTAVWFTGGTPEEVARDVGATVQKAAAAGSVPVLVAYNVPGRDCSGYSAGGAASGDAYKAWIDAFASALGRSPAIVILEPDSLANLPSDCGQPDTFGRLGLISYGVHSLSKDPKAAVYLDAGHSHWHSTGDIAARLVQAGVAQARGFFVNVSNYQPADQTATWGRWVSKCIYFATKGRPADRGQFGRCASQYGPATVDDYSTWRLSDRWYDENVGNPPSNQLAHFVIDTSRNGRGPWVAPAGHPAGDAQEWCNPPGRGVGIRPTSDTGDPLIDAYVWAKVPGESDGSCGRWTSGPTDPVRNAQDPAAGKWFPDMALELARNANPPF